jgi:hypothetical protein
MEKTMQRKIITTNLGELIVAVTDEVKSIVRDPADLYGVVSCILSDLLARQRLRVPKQSPGKYPSYFAKELAQKEMTQWPD